MRSVIAAIAMVSTLVPSARAEGPVGVTSIPVTAPDSGRELTVTVWYPAKPGGKPILIGDNAVFEGVEGHQDAPIADGELPTVLISHGGLRSARNLSAWIGSALAAQGFVAAAVEGPRLGPDEAREAVTEIRERPADLSAALTVLVEDPAWTKHLDPDAIAALGFSLGGTSVLSLAGGRLDADDFRRSCDPDGHGIDCAWFQANGVDLGSIDVSGLGRSHHDPRLGAAIVVDPELSTSFAAQSLAELAIPVTIVNLGRPGTIPPGLDASTLAGASPRIAYTTLPDATRFSAFGLCKPKGAAILKEEGGDDAMCRDGAGETRKGIHRELSALIIDRLREHLPSRRP
jgi:predicted dienelactone hydrolase